VRNSQQPSKHYGTTIVSFTFVLASRSSFLDMNVYVSTMQPVAVTDRTAIIKAREKKISRAARFLSRKEETAKGATFVMRRLLRTHA